MKNILFESKKKLLLASGNSKTKSKGNDFIQTKKLKEW